MSRLVRCPMRECRRALDLDAGGDAAAATPRMHLVAVWRDGAAMASAVLRGLDGNRELVIRNVRPAAFDAESLAPHRGTIEVLVRQSGKVVEPADDASHEAGALFGDQHECDAISRELAQLLIGPDPMISRVAG